MKRLGAPSLESGWVKLTLSAEVCVFSCSIYKVHAENKDKDFELEVSWLCEASGNRFQPVPVEMVAVSAFRSSASLKRLKLTLPFLCSSGRGAEGQGSAGR